ncbi:MAG: cupin domain-containing protein [Candidatus Woesebacteria bacterium]|jgi:mannose-6-phosphate isomerase-like protein (cupin superfamily)
MKIIKKSDTTPFANSETCYGVEFPFESQALNIAIITIDGRYPAKGRLVNEVCQEIAYVMSGSGKIGFDGHEQDLQAGDAIFLDANEPYYWQGNKMQLFVPCSPAFYPEQHKEINTES